MTEQERIMARLKSLQAQRPNASDDEQRSIDAEATTLCDRLKHLKATAYKPRGVL